MRYLLAYAVSLTVIFGCKPSISGGHSDSLEALIERTSHEPDPDRLSSVNPSGTESLLQVTGYPELEPFWVPAASQDLEQFPCSECHNRSLSQMSRGAAPEQDRAHWNITMEHAGDDVMTCTTCHDTQNAELLTTLNDRDVELDHSYKVCAQCHNAIADDWAGGAHGKRIGGWTPPRVVTSCVSCHDPHQPAWDTRWPARTGRSAITDNP